ncbi:MAG: bifunctional demethylmenaquinone methyltransferase/2-methoxy-6-polyprenyl-1,4-benzoquinol methylase UbiE [Sedimentisphaerales bacterium]|nr:bifunctional demethylmenaquinone methyltransferase/2-methoxy-6-polyprenyl-1,4-benzoquinol methylase UbiE [Sedimentisphaerales bacterium]
MSPSFGPIARTYDFLNHLLSLGCDFRWRRQAADLLGGRGPLKVVDLATGTGDMALALLRRREDVAEVTALDISEEMLSLARRKAGRNGLAQRVCFVRDDATETSLPAASFDAATMAFGIRNTPDAAQTLEEMCRLLKPGGTAVVLEFSLPGNRLVCAGYLAYLRFVVPLAGGLISGNREAYRYLNRSIEAFHQPAAFCHLMEQAGFAHVQVVPLTWGVASIYSGSKR